MIIATYQGHEVEIIDTFWSDSALIAVVHALDGSEPFVGGDKWPVKTDWANVLACNLENIQVVKAPENDYCPDEYKGE